MNSKARVHPMLLTSLIGFAAAGGFSTAQAQVMCGDTITTSEVLTSDLNCSGFNPALTIQGPGGRLNMRRFTLSCEGSGAFGIRMTDSGARLRNGTVANCFDGVVLSGAQAQVSRMILRGNVAGLGIFSGSGHRISDTVATGNSSFAFFDNGEGNNFFNRNRATDNRAGFLGSNDRYTRNVASGNVGSGFLVGAGNTLNHNTSKQNQFRGFSVDGGNNTLTGNIVRNNLDDGIDVSFGAIESTFSGNDASGNGSADLEGNGGFDLEDDHPDCDNNTWTNNTGTRNQTCIQ